MILQQETSQFNQIKQPQIIQDYPPNLSISLSGGKENNCDSPSSGERRGKSSDWKSTGQFKTISRIVV